MAGEKPDKAQQTEDATPKKLEEARKKGNLPTSREVANCVSIGGMLLLTAFYAPTLGTHLGETVLIILSNAGDAVVATAFTDLTRLIWNTAVLVALAIAAIVTLFGVGGVMALVFQNALVIAPDRLKPKLERVDPIKGWSRIFGMSAFVEFLKNLSKVFVVAAVVYLIVMSEMEAIEASVHYEAFGLPDIMQLLLIKLLFGVFLATLVIAVLDILWRRYDWKRQLKMTKQEVKDERRQTEGDPHVKARLREIRRERARARMMADVPKSTLVLANPTHFSIALRYVHGETAAPVCLAKGVDQVALKIREVARENDVMVIENPELTRALYKQVEIGEMIPAEFFRTVAEIITYVYNTQERAIRVNL